VDVIATNVDDSSVSVSYRINVEILDTAAVGVSDESSDQSFLPGDPATTDRTFEITNYGNSDDRFTITLDIPDGMVAELIDPVPVGGIATTTVIPSGETWDATVRFRFLADADGTLTLGLTATSVSDPTISDTGEATYLVGRQGTIDLTPPAPIEIVEADLIYTMEVEVKNKLNPLVYPAQTISMDKVPDSAWSSYISVRIANDDGSFSLESDASRTVTVEVEVSEATLINLPSDTLTVNFTIYATSLTVADSPTAKLTVVLKKQSADNGEGDGTSSEENGELVKNIVLWSGFLIVVGILGFITFKIVTSVDKDDDFDDWDDMMYQDSLTATYGAVAAAPTVPMAPPPISEPTAMPDTASPPSAGPPLPPEGLPDGWTMEQWEHYGQKYLDGEM
jgi:hypothetical protein